MDKSDLVVLANRHRNVFLVDLSWVLYKSWYSYYKGQGLSVNIDGKEQPTGHIYGVLRAIIAMKKRDNKCMIVLCRDGKPINRKSENEDYKANREGVEGYNLYDDLDSIIDMSFRISDVYLAYNPVLEADDIMYSLAKKMETMTSNTNLYIYSGDNDLLQAITDRIKVCRKITNHEFLVIDEDYIMTNTPMIRNFRYCPPKKLPFYRSMIGDKSDNLKGFYRFPRMLATRIAKDIECLEDIKNLKYEDLTPSKQKHLQKCKDEFDKLQSNYNLMNLKEDIEYEVWRDESDESRMRASEYSDLYEMSYYQSYLISSGTVNYEEFVSW